MDEEEKKKSRNLFKCELFPFFITFFFVRFVPVRRNGDDL